jgi:hypothetical protein
MVRLNLGKRLSVSTNAKKWLDQWIDMNLDRANLKVPTFGIWPGARLKIASECIP